MRLICRRRVLCGALLLALLGALQQPGLADKGPWPDRGDGRGPLAIRRVAIGHGRPGTSTVTVVFERAVKPSDLRLRDLFVIEFDGYGDGRTDLAFYAWGGERKWYTHSYYPRYKEIADSSGFSLRKMAPNAYRVVIDDNIFFPNHPRGGLRFWVGSYSKTGPHCASGCFDASPNAGWLIHDWTRPTLTRFHVPEFSILPGDTPKIPVKWRVIDRGYARVAQRSLWTRVAGTTQWRLVSRDRSAALIEESITAEPGKRFELKVTAIDRAGNKLRPQYRHTVVPFDDASTERGAKFLGVWNEEDREDAYLNGIRVSSLPLDQFDFAGEGTKYCVSYRTGPEFGSASFDVEGSALSAIVMDGSVAGNTKCVSFDSKATRTALVKVGEGIINIDAFWME